VDPQRAVFYLADSNGRATSSYYRVMFNPSDLQMTKSLQLAEMNVPGLDAPLQQFVRGQAERLTVRLFFDTTDRGGGPFATPVTEQTDKFYSFVKIDSETHVPPVCIFAWGSRGFPGSKLPTNENQRRDWFTGVVESVQQEFTLFSTKGVPLRATLTVTMREFKTLSAQRIQLHLLSHDRTRSHMVQRGETLTGIAGEVYGDPGAWRAIALHPPNRIVNPRRLRAGTILEIPPIDRGVSTAADATTAAVGNG
jgi:contractile injection system tube protein